jgi:hypothetical protein
MNILKNKEAKVASRRFNPFESGEPKEVRNPNVDLMYPHCTMVNSYMMTTLNDIIV